MNDRSIMIGFLRVHPI